MYPEKYQKLWGTLRSFRSSISYYPFAHSSSKFHKYMLFMLYMTGPGKKHPTYQSQPDVGLHDLVLLILQGEGLERVGRSCNVGLVRESQWLTNICSFLKDSAMASPALSAFIYQRHISAGFYICRGVRAPPGANVLFELIPCVSFKQPGTGWVHDPPPTLRDNCKNWRKDKAKISRLESLGKDGVEGTKGRLTTLMSWMKASPKATSTFCVMFSTGRMSLL
jgi:hypothetical protein